ncbi:MAG: tetratricopeptide (TPR) repeat protein, partial [Bradymonadia bacterium]
MPTAQEPTPPGSLLPASPIDPDAITALGVPLLGEVPPAVPIDPAARYPDGRVPVDLSLPASLPPLRPRFRGRPTLEGAGVVRQPVLDTLIDDTTATTDRVRMAERLYAIGSLLPVQSVAAREAFIVAAANDPSHLLNDWSTQRALTQMGDAQALVQWLDRADADADRLHAAGHAARHLAGDADWALDLWWNALSADPQALAPLLASYLEALGTGKVEAAGAFAEMLFKAAQGKLLGVLGLDRSLRGQGQLTADELRTEIHAALIDSNGSPAAVAAAEEVGGRTDDDGLVADALAARLNALEAEAEASDVRAEIGVLATRLGWLRERAGDLDGALVAYARAVDHDDAATFARRRALALGRRRDNLPLVYRLLGDLADRADLPEAVRAAALVERAEVAFQVERPAEARADLARAVAQDPTYVPALAALGRVSLTLEDLPGRIRLYEVELAALQRAMADAPESAARLTPRYVERATRLAQLHLLDGRDHKAALAACRVALDAAPGDRSAFLTAARVFTHLEQWAALAALNVARAGHTDGPEAAECLAVAADLRARQLNDATGAAKLLARALDLAPTHPYVLRRAAEIFALTGHRAAWAEVERRLGEQDPVRLARAGRLFEHGPDSQGDAVEAFCAALAAAVAPIDSLDGLTRVAARTGDVTALSAAVAQAQVAHAPRVALAMAETLIAAGGAEAALPLLRRLRDAGHPAPVLEVVAAERAGAWPVVVEGLRAQAALVDGAARAALLTRAGQVLALRLGDRGEAIGAFVEALENDPTSALAQSALTRWRPAPIGSTGEGPIDEARAARAAGDWRAHDAALLTAASDASMRAEAMALRTASGAVNATIAATRDDLFERFWASDAGEPERLAALHARAQAAEPAGAARWWRRLMRTALAASDHALARTAAERLRALTPNSLPAALALARIGEKTGDGALEHAALESLVDGVRSAQFKEAVAARRSAVASDPVGRARSLVHRGAWDDAYHAIAPVLGPAASVDAWRLAAQIHSARNERVGALRAHEALFKRLSGALAADAALAVAGLHADGGSPGLAADWV